MSRNVRLLEYAAVTSDAKVDGGAHVLENCKLLGESSLNPPPRNNLYPRATREAAAPRFEGARVYLDHPADPRRPRSYGDCLGRIRNVREGGDGLYGDFHLNPAHRLAEQVLWDARNSPDSLGFSINADGKGRRGTDGRQIIEDIPVVHSIDLVSRGATTHSLFESRTPPMPVTWKSVLESLKAQKKPRHVRALREAMDMMSAEDSDTMPDDYKPGAMGEDGAEPPANADDAVKSGLRAGMMAILDDESLDTKGKLARMKKFLLAEEDLLAKGGSADDEPDEPEEPMEEGQRPGKTARGLKRLEEEIKVRDLIEESNLKFAKPSARKVFIQSLIPLAEADRRELIDERLVAQAATPTQPARAGQQPRSSSPGGGGGTGGSTRPVQEARQPAAAVPADPDKARAERVARLCQG